MPEGGVGSVFKKDDDVVNREALFNLTSGMDFVFTKMMQAVFVSDALAFSITPKA